MKYLSLFETFRQKNLDRLLDKLESYRLVKDDFAIFGSAPLVVSGDIEDVRDLDVIIRPSAWPFDTIGEFRDSEIEFFDNWPGFDIDDLIDNHSFEYRGFRFIDTEFVYQYKAQMKRSKDRDLWDKGNQF